MNEFASAAAGKYKRRRITELSIGEKAELILAYLVDYKPRKDVALQFRVSEFAVTAFSNKFKKASGLLDRL